MSYIDLFKLLEEDKYEEADEYISNNSIQLVDYYGPFDFVPTYKIIEYLLNHQINPTQINYFYSLKIHEDYNIFKLTLENIDIKTIPVNFFYNCLAINDNIINLLITHNYDFINNLFVVKKIFCHNQKYILIFIDTYNLNQTFLCSVFLLINDVHVLTILADYINFNQEYNDRIMENMLSYKLPEPLTGNLIAKDYYFSNDSGNQGEKDLVEKIQKYDVSLYYLARYMMKYIEKN
jgi:hypothetical protein